jgi:hypothetical protein
MIAKRLTTSPLITITITLTPLIFPCFLGQSTTAPQKPLTIPVPLAPHKQLVVIALSLTITITITYHDYHCQEQQPSKQGLKLQGLRSTTVVTNWCIVVVGGRCVGGVTCHVSHQHDARTRTAATQHAQRRC